MYDNNSYGYNIEYDFAGPNIYIPPDDLTMATYNNIFIIIYSNSWIFFKLISFFYF